MSKTGIGQKCRVVPTDLLRNRPIPDFYQGNEFRLQWIGLTAREYHTSFSVDSATLAQGHAKVVLDGLDTFADVYLSHQAVLQANQR